GRNCEFGLVQQRMGLDPIGLLRWAGSPYNGLVSALQAQFAGLCLDVTGAPDPDTTDGTRWIATCQRYGIDFHIKTPIPVTSVAQAMSMNFRRIQWLASNLIENIRDCRNILVYSSREATTTDDIEDLVGVIRSFSLCPMLTVLQAEDAVGD